MDPRPGGPQEAGPSPAPAGQGFRPGKASLQGHAGSPVEDAAGIRKAVNSRIVLISHLWPGITPWTVWDLPYGLWRGYAASHDAYVQQQREAARG